MAKGIKGACAKPVDVDFNGETYKVTPLTFEDFTNIWKDLQSQKVQTVRELIEDKDERRILIREIINQPMGDEFFEELSSLTGFQSMIYQSLKKNYPDLKKEDIGNLPLESTQEIGDIVRTISGVADDEDGEVDSPEKKGSTENEVEEKP